MEKLNITDKSLEEAAINFATSTKHLLDAESTVFMDRTVYYSLPKVDEQNRVLTDDEGNVIVEIRPYITAGCWVPEYIKDIAEDLEKRFPKLNKLYRDNYEKQGKRWRLREGEINKLEIRRLQ